MTDINKYQYIKRDYLILKQRGGGYALYIQYSREHVDDMMKGIKGGEGVIKKKVEHLIDDAKKRKRYYIVKIIDGKKTVDGYDTVYGEWENRLDDFEKYKKVLGMPDPTNNFGYETTLIWKYLKEMNNTIDGIKTIQSQPAYYLDYRPDDPDDIYKMPYFQVPFVEFQTEQSYWLIAKWITEELYKKYGYSSTSYYQKKSDGVTMLRFCIFSSYYDKNDNLKNTIDDSDFFGNIVECLKNAKKEIDGKKIKIEESLYNDLDLSKPWYYFSKNEMMYVLKVKDPQSGILYVHQETNAPFTSMNVRYVGEIDAFTKPLSATLTDKPKQVD
jgi:hypothetical protein